MSGGIPGVADFAFDEAELEFLEACAPPATTVSVESLTDLLPAVYDELRRMAANYLRDERSEHTLQPTALVHEAYLRLAGQRQSSWQNRSHLLAIAARMMRRILTNHAVTRSAAKRGGAHAVRLTLDDALEIYDQPEVRLLDVEDALRALDSLDRRQAQIVEMRFFAGLTTEEISEVLGISVRTVEREWSFAKRWLQRELAKARSDAR